MSFEKERLHNLLLAIHHPQILFWFQSKGTNVFSILCSSFCPSIPNGWKCPLLVLILSRQSGRLDRSLLGRSLALASLVFHVWDYLSLFLHTGSSKEEKILKSLINCTKLDNHKRQPSGQAGIVPPLPTAIYFLIYFILQRARYIKWFKSWVF